MPRTRSIAWSELKIGIVGIAAIVLLSVIIVAVGATAGFFWQMYPLKARFADAKGMKAGTVVRVAGKEIGKVTSVDFAGAEIEVGLKINKSVRQLVTTGSTASIGSLSLLGESIIDISPAPQGRPLNDYEYVSSAKPKGSIGELTLSATESLQEAQKLIADMRAGRGSVGKFLTDDAVYNELHRFVTAAADVSKNLREGKGTLGALANDPAAYNAMKASLDNLNAITARINTGQGALGRLLNDEAMGRSLSSSIASLEATTGRINSGQGTLGKLISEKELYDKLNSLSAHIDQVTAGLDSGKGTMGRLLKDEALYENMNRMMSDLNLLIADIRKDPKKFLNVKVSIF
jgi:phospholipid/cholesterol/gamma-HCH transport system substrate-binding protein